MLRRSCGTFQCDSCEMSRPATTMRPSVGCSSRSSRRRNVDLPEPGRADEEQELALADVGRHVAERGDVALVDLGDVLEADHREQGPRVAGGTLRFGVSPARGDRRHPLSPRSGPLGAGRGAGGATAGTPR